MGDIAGLGYLGLTGSIEEWRPLARKRLVQIMCYDPSIASEEMAQQRSELAQRFPEHNNNRLVDDFVANN